jgi:hypothetical protein
VHIRAVRFTGVTPQTTAAVTARIEGDGGPPPGVRALGIQVLVDGQQGTALVLQHYASAEDMAAAEAIFDAMDPGETPGVRVSVDRCEVRVDRTL